MLIALLGNDITQIIFWIFFSGSLILLSFSNDVDKKTQKTSPIIFATITTSYLGSGICIILGSALYAFPELGFILQVGMVIMGVFLVLMWLQRYKQHRSV